MAHRRRSASCMRSSPRCSADEVVTAGPGLDAKFLRSQSMRAQALPTSESAQKISEVLLSTAELLDRDRDNLALNLRLRVDSMAALGRRVSCCLEQTDESSGELIKSVTMGGGENSAPRTPHLARSLTMGVGEDSTRTRTPHLAKMSVDAHAPAEDDTFSSHPTTATSLMCDSKHKQSRVSQPDLDITVLEASQVRKGAPLGTGTFADVFRGSLVLDDARGANKEQPVALKKLRSTKDPEDMLRFVEEADIMEKLHHPSIVASLGISMESDTPYMVQELATHGSLKDLLIKAMLAPRKRRPYTWDDALRWLGEIASALAFLHDMRPNMIIHRDLKADNILLCADGQGGLQAKLADFGLARMVDCSVAQESSMYDSTPRKQQQTARMVTNHTSPLSVSSGELRTPPTAGDSPSSAQERVATRDARLDDERLQTAGAGLAPKASMDASWELPVARPAAAPAAMGTHTHTHTAPAATGTFWLTGDTGSSLYMAPEVAAMQPYNEACDVYSFAMILLETLNFYPIAIQASPQGSMAEIERYAKRMHGGDRPTIPQRIPCAIADVIKACWHQDPTQRPRMRDIVPMLDGLRAHPDVLQHDAKLGSKSKLGDRSKSFAAGSAKTRAACKMM